MERAEGQLDEATVARPCSCAPSADETPVGGAVEDPSRSVARVLVGNTSWSTLAQLFPLAVNLVLTPYVIHGFGVERWGFIALVTSIQSLLATFDGGLITATQRFFAIFAGSDDRVRTTRMVVTVTLMIAVFGVVVSGAVWVLAPAILTLFHAHGPIRGEGMFLMRSLGVLVAVGFLHNVFASVLYARQRYGLASIVNMGTYCVWAVGLFLCVRFGWGLRGVALVFIAQQVLATVCVVPSASRYLTRKGFRLMGRAEFRELFRYASRLWIMGLSYLCNTQVDGLIVGATLSLKPLAYYNTGAGFVSQLRTASANALSPMTVVLSRTLGSRGKDATYREYLRLQRIWVCGISGWTAAAMGAAYFGIVAWLGPDFRLAGEVAVVLLVGQAAGLIAMLLAIFCTAVGYPELEMRYGIVSMVVNIGLTIPLAFTGAIGIVAATSAGMVVASGALIAMTRRRIRRDLPNYFRQVPIVRSLLTGIVVVLLELAIHPVVPGGALGLLMCAVPAVIGLAFFGLLILGPRSVWAALSGAIGHRDRLPLSVVLRSLVRDALA